MPGPQAPSPTQQKAQRAIEWAIDLLMGGIGLPDPKGPEAQQQRYNPHALGEVMQMLAGVPLIKAGARALTPIRAFHGSPHDFDKFDLSKIGTGEGAQAYGHGLYFSENPSVAETYRRGETMNANADIAGAAVPAWLLRRIEDGRDSIQSARRWFSDIAATTSDTGQKRAAGEVVRGLDAMAKGQPPTYRGRMYEVNIHADPDTLLDWDMPLSQQAEQLRQAVGKVERPYGTGPHTSGGEWVRARSDMVPLKVPRSVADADTSQVLRDAGVPGLKYLDQGSRVTGKGSSNYVMFDDSIIEILRKYGVLMPLMAGALAKMPAAPLERPQ